MEKIANSLDISTLFLALCQVFSDTALRIEIGVLGSGYSVQEFSQETWNEERDRNVCNQPNNSF